MIFYKYHGTGNDFIIVDNREETISISQHRIAEICSRHTGVGADGFILIENHHVGDFYMRYYNSDGNVSTMCGNGGRCAVLFAKQIGVIEQNETNFAAADGMHYAEILDNGLIALKMNAIGDVEINGKAFVLDTGSPHYVRFMYDVDELDVCKEGQLVRNSAQFKREGINVNFVEERGRTLFVRTYERGVEGETLSCGTGVTAAAISLYRKQNYRGNKLIPIETLGGKLKVQIESSEFRKIDRVWLIGPAVEVFIGDIAI